MTEASHHSPLTIAAHQGHAAVYELLLHNGAGAAHRALPKLEEPFKTDGGTAEQILKEHTCICQEQQMATAPAELMHPAHCHQLLKTTRRYGCDICEGAGDGWVYHCEECDWDAHLACVGAILDEKEATA